MATHRWLESLLHAAPVTRSDIPETSLLSPVEAGFMHDALR